MPDRLSGLRTAVDHDPVAVLQAALLSQTIGEVDRATHQRGMCIGSIGERGDMLGRDDEEVGRRLGVDVCKREEPLRLRDDVGGQAAACDAAEETVRSIHPAQEAAGASLAAGASFAESFAAACDFAASASFAAFALSVTQQRFLQKYLPLR